MQKRLIRTGLLFLIFLLAASCAHRPQTSPDIATAQPLAPASTEPSQIVYQETGLPNLDGLSHVTKLEIDLPYADLTVTRTAHGEKRGKITTKLLPVLTEESADEASAKTPSPEQCQITFKQKDDSLILSERERSQTMLSGTFKFLNSIFPRGFECRYGIEIELPQPAAIEANLKRGSVNVEDWTQPIKVNLGWGDLNFGRVKDLTLKCSRCTLAGEDVEGPVDYEIDNGNVGLNGLMKSVKGHTNGDTILHWSKTDSTTAVNVRTKAGEVVLAFPKGVSVNPEFEVGRGEVLSDVSSNGARRISVIAKVGQGNLRVYNTSAQ